MIDQELEYYDTFDLHGIVWHHGRSLNTGHYTSNVKVKDTWYSTNDSYIARQEEFHSRVSNVCVC